MWVYEEAFYASLKGRTEMPAEVFVAKVKKSVGDLRVECDVHVTGPLYGGTSGKPRPDAANQKANSLADRIERAINTAIVNFKHDFGILDQA